ncbi:ABC transporter permease [Lactococcus garvieae]|uniref:ABC transporter permease n=1 Tax=Lactococcus garvieae TaxID=1363 RepID=UPI0023EC4EDF|nr:ABC transporter permease [Lactococcus garvieae]
MNAKNIFKMEMYKNIMDKTYMIVLAVFISLSLLLNFSWLAVSLTNIDFQNFPILLTFLSITTVFAIIGLAIFSLLYPFHLLNIDYKNKVMSLMIASGVSRVKYYFVKIGTTILTQLIALFLILVVPFVTFFIFNQETVFSLFRSLDLLVHSADIFTGLLSFILGLIAMMVTMALAVIITRGSTSGLFVYIAFNFASRILQTVLMSLFFLFLAQGGTSDFSTSFVSNNSFFSIGYHIIEIFVFGLIGIFYLRKQDL